MTLAREKYEAGVEKWQALPQAGVQMSQADLATAAPGTGVDGAIAAVEAGSTAQFNAPMPLIPPPGRLRTELMVIDAIVAAVAAVAAVGLGLTLLWANDASWGGVDDIVIAVLWGLGLHQGTGAAFVGLRGTAQAIAGIRPPEA